MPELTEHIYILSDPRDNTVRYVGRTNDVRSRYSGHVTVKNSGNPQKDVWIQELAEEGLRPTMTVVESTPYGTPPTYENGTPVNREKYWIQHFQAQGANLLNKPHRSAGVSMPIAFANQEKTYQSPEEENAFLRAENLRLREIIRQIVRLTEDESL